MENGCDHGLVGLLYQRDSDSTDFPLTDLKRAIRCFNRRRDCRGLEPATVHLHPSQADLLDPGQAAALGVTIEASPKVPLNYLWLVGRPKAAPAFSDCETTEQDQAAAGDEDPGPVTAGRRKTFRNRRDVG